MMKVGFKFAALALALAAVTCGTTQAALLWYDGFSLSGDGGDYTLTSAGPTDPLGGQSGGAGTFLTGGPWVGPTAGWVLPDTLERTFPNNTPAQIVPSVGGAVGSNPDARTGCCLTSRNGIEMATPWGGFTDPDGTFYMSFLANFGEGPTLHHRVIEWWDGAVGDGNITLAFGISQFSGIGNGERLGLRVKDSDTNSTGHVLLGDHTTWEGIEGITQFVLLKFEMSTGGPDTISLYLNPVGDEGDNTPDAQVSVGQFLMTHLGSFSNFVFGPATEAMFDELRVGDTWGDVQNNLAAHYVNVPPPVIPEPASLSLVGLALLGLVSSMRRRS